MSLHLGPEWGWVMDLGGSPRDYPGAAAVLAAGAVDKRVAELPPPPARDFWEVEPEVGVILLRGSAFELFGSGVLELAGQAARASGRRTLVRYPFGEEGGEGGSRRERQVLAAQLLVGGGLVVEDGVELPAPLRRTVELARSRADMIELPLPDVGLLLPSGPIDGALRTVARLERAGRGWTVLSLPDTREEWDRVSERVSRFDTLVAGDDEADRHLRGMLGSRSKSKVLSEEALASLGEWGSRDVVLRRRDLPADAAVAVHSLDRSAGGSAVTHVRVPFRPWRLTDGCTAERLDFETGVKTPMTCSMEADRRTARVEVPLNVRPTTWAAVVVRPVVPTPPGEPHSGIRLLGAGGHWAGAVPIEVPYWPAPQATSLSLPEWIDADGSGDLWAEASGTAEVAPDGRSGVYHAAGGPISLRAQLLAGRDSIEVELTLTNRGDRRLEHVRALICLAASDQPLFPSWGHGRTSWFDETGERPLTALREGGAEPLYIEHDKFATPVTATRSVDGRWSLANAFEGSEVIGGNGATSVCLHSRPTFGPLPPGASQTRRGLMFMTADRPGEIVSRWREFTER